jgi:hypothetical protein
MISTHSFLFWDMGAPVIHRYNRPSEVMLLRSASYLLSVGATLLELPIISYFSSYLADGLRGYAIAGVKDEAFLRNALSLQKRSSSLNDQNELVLKWLFWQNINPFLPKTEGMEDSVISANASLLKL